MRTQTCCCVTVGWTGRTKTRKDADSSKRTKPQVCHWHWTQTNRTRTTASRRRRMTRPIKTDVVMFTLIMSRRRCWAEIKRCNGMASEFGQASKARFGLRSESSPAHSDNLMSFCVCVYVRPSVFQLSAATRLKDEYLTSTLTRASFRLVIGESPL